MAFSLSAIGFTLFEELVDLFAGFMGKLSNHKKYKFGFGSPLMIYISTFKQKDLSRITNQTLVPFRISISKFIHFASTPDPGCQSPATFIKTHLQSPVFIPSHRMHGMENIYQSSVTWIQKNRYEYLIRNTATTQFLFGCRPKVGVCLVPISWAFWQLKAACCTWGANDLLAGLHGGAPRNDAMVAFWPPKETRDF